MTKQSLGIAVVFGLLFCSVMADARAPQVIDLALAGIGVGSAAEIKGRIKTTSYTYLDPPSRARAVAALPGAIRHQLLLRLRGNQCES